MVYIIKGQNSIESEENKSIFCWNGAIWSWNFLIVYVKISHFWPVYLLYILSRAWALLIMEMSCKLIIKKEPVALSPYLHNEVHILVRLIPYHISNVFIFFTSLLFLNRLLHDKDRDYDIIFLIIFFGSRSAHRCVRIEM